MTDGVVVYDPDGSWRTIERAEADAMVERGEGLRCEPDDWGGTVHWHRYERWPEDEK